MAAERPPHIESVFIRYNRQKGFAQNVVPVKENKITLESSKRIILLNKEQILTENPENDPDAADIEAHIEEASRLKGRLTELQPKIQRMVYKRGPFRNFVHMQPSVIMLSDSTRKEVRKINDVKNYIGIQIEKLRAPLSKNPSLAEKFDPKLLEKLHLQPRK